MRIHGAEILGWVARVVIMLWCLPMGLALVVFFVPPIVMALVVGKLCDLAGWG